MSNNPAFTHPAISRQRTLYRTITNPAGEEEQPPSADSKTGPKSKYEVGWRRIVRNFSPSWFSVTMGTGVVAVILDNIPWKADWLYYLSLIFFVFNVGLFSVAFAISVVRYTLYPEIWTVLLRDSTNSLFLGCIPMGFATLVSMFISVCVPPWGLWSAYFAWGMWILDAILAVTVTVGMGVLLMTEHHQRSLDTIMATQLLPISATVVSAATGSKMPQVLPNPQHALGTIIACYVMLGLSIPLAFIVLVVYYQRLALHKMPPREVIVSAFLPLGPLGYGGYTFLNLGVQANRVFPLTHSIDPLAGRIAYILGFFCALILWGFGLMWFGLALASIHMSRPFPFNMGWWGFTFPLGVYSLSTILIGKHLPSLFFRVLGTIFGTCVILLWIVCAAGTARGAWRGELFNAPCLKMLKPKEGDSPQDVAALEKETQDIKTSDHESPSDP